MENKIGKVLFFLSVGVAVYSAYVAIPTRSSSNINTSADINQLQANIVAVNDGVGPVPGTNWTNRIKSLITVGTYTNYAFSAGFATNALYATSATTAMFFGGQLATWWLAYITNKDFLLLPTNGSRPMAGLLGAHGGLLVSNSFDVITGANSIAIGNAGTTGNIYVGGASSGVSILQGGTPYLSVSTAGGFSFNSGDLNANNNYISNVPIPAASTHAASKAYVDAATNGMVDLSTVTNIANTAASNMFEYITYSLQGNLIVASNQIRVHIPFDCTFGANAYAAVFNEPVGAALNIDVTLNGNSILTSSNLSIASGAFKGTNSIATSTANMLDQLMLHVTQVGSTTNGGFLTVVIPIKRR